MTVQELIQALKLCSNMNAEVYIKGEDEFGCEEFFTPYFVGEISEDKVEIK